MQIGSYVVWTALYVSTCCSGVHDLYDSWCVEHEGQSGAQHVGKTLSYSSLLLLTRRISARSSYSERHAHRRAWRTGRT